MPSVWSAALWSRCTLVRVVSRVTPFRHLKPVDPDADVAETAKAIAKQREPPETLVAPMLPYQKEGLHWMCSQVAPQPAALLLTARSPIHSNPNQNNSATLVRTTRSS